MVRLLQPWHENVSKRRVGAPKLFIRDSGLVHTLLGIGAHEALLHHAKLGDSWEGFALEEAIRPLDFDTAEVCFWAPHAGAELDLLAMCGDRRPGYQIKYTASPRVIRSMRSAIDTLGLDRLVLIYPGKRRLPLAADGQAVGLAELVREGTAP